MNALKKRKYNENFSELAYRIQYLVNVHAENQEIKEPELKVNAESNGLMDEKYERDYDLIR